MTTANTTIIDALRERLSGRPGKALVLSLACEALADAALLDALCQFMYRAEEPLRWRAVWVLGKVSEQQASLLVGERSRIMREAMQSSTPVGVRRLLLGIYSHISDGTEFDVEFFNFLLDEMVSLQSPPGVQALAMKLAARMSCVDEALHEEFCCIVQNMELDYYSAGVRSVARRCMKTNKKKNRI